MRKHLTSSSYITEGSGTKAVTKKKINIAIYWTKTFVNILKRWVSDPRNCSQESLWGSKDDKNLENILNEYEKKNNYRISLSCIMKN